MGHQVSGSPVVSNGRVYCGAADNVMYCLEAATGKLIWKFSVGAPITSAATLQNGIIYFGSLDHRVYAIKA
jgi:outer membrane protein assembly factor BamB